MTDRSKETAFRPAAGESVQAVRKRPLANRNFRLLWLGETVSLFGDQFYFIALPWLVFDMTGSSLAFGTLLMAEGIPRAVFLLIGGVMTDRLSPRSVMMASNLLRLGIVTILTLIVAGQVTQLWMLYVMAISFGVVDAFFHPAYRAMIPMIVEDDQLQESNSLTQGAAQIVQIAGPGTAGVLVQTVGMALSFAFDALTFLFTSIMLLLMRPPALPPAQVRPEAGRKRGGIVGEIGEMLAYVRQDAILPTIIAVIAAVNLLFAGPLVVGTATLGRERFAEGSAAFGAMLSAFAIGMLIGMLAAGWLHARRAGFISLLLVASEGVLMVGVGYATSLVLACGLLLLTGIGAGFGNITVVTMTQKRVTKDLMGRFMSLILLAEVGLTPISNALAGLLADMDVTAMFTLAGVLLTATALAALLNRDLRKGEL